MSEFGNVEADAISVIRDGARQKIEHAKQQWWIDAYKAPPEQRAAALEHWRSVQNRVDILVRELRKALKDTP